MCRSMKYFVILVTVFVLASASFAVAETTGQSDKWEFGAAIYGWLPSINGDIVYPISGTEETLTVDPGTILENLKMTAQVGLGAKKNKWAIIADIIYMDLGDDQSATGYLPNDETLTANFDMGMKAWIVDFDGAYTIAKSERNETQLLFGVRYLWLESTLDISTDAQNLPGQALAVSGDVLDAIIGLRGVLALGGKWAIPYRVDIGTGESDFTWKGQAGIDYGWSWGGAMLLYRYLYYEDGDSMVIKKLEMPGPLLGMRFMF